MNQFMDRLLISREKGIANPLATILASAMMLRHALKLDAEANAIEAAVSDVLNAGHRTADIASGERAFPPLKWVKKSSTQSDDSRYRNACSFNCSAVVLEPRFRESPFGSGEAKLRRGFFATTWDTAI